MSDTSVHHEAGVVPQPSLQGLFPPPLAQRDGAPEQAPSSAVFDSAALEPAQPREASVRWPRVFPGL